MGKSVVQLEDTYARWLKRTDEALRLAFDAYDLREAGGTRLTRPTGCSDASVDCGLRGGCSPLVQSADRNASAASSLDREAAPKESLAEHHLRERVVSDGLGGTLADRSGMGAFDHLVEQAECPLGARTTLPSLGEKPAEQSLT